MPHLIIEHNQLVSLNIDTQQLASELHNILATQETIKANSIKTRTVMVSNTVIGTIDPEPGFMHITLLLLPGRTPELKDSIGKALFNCATKALMPIEKFESTGSLTLEIRDLGTYFR